MSFLKKIFKKEVKVEDGVKQSSPYHVKKDKPKNKPKEGPNGKEMYRKEKAERRKLAEEKRAAEKAIEDERLEKELELSKQQEVARKQELEQARVLRETKQQEVAAKRVEKVIEDKPVDLYGVEIDTLEQGQVITVEVLGQDRENYLVHSTSNYQEALLPFYELGDTTLEVGDKLEVLVYRHSNDDFYVSLRRHENKKILRENLGNISTDSIMNGTVIEYKEPFFIVQLEKGLKGKVFIRNIDNTFVREPEKYVGKNYSFGVKQKYEDSHNIQFELDRRSIMQEQSKIAAQSLLADTVIKINEYQFNKGGLEFNYNGIRGFVPMRELSHSYLNSIEEASTLFTGNIEVKIIEVQEKNGNFQILGSIKATQKSPWEEFVVNHEVNDVVEVVIKKIERYGMFLAINDNVRGLMHNNDTSTAVAALAKQLKVGDHLTVKIKSIDLDKKQINFTSDLNENITE